jgi:hypothetical protein
MLRVSAAEPVWGASMTEPELSSAYRREGHEVLLEIRLREIRQLFNTLDPAPFHQKDLDPDAERYLLDACREAGPHRALRLVVHLPPPEVASEAAKTLPDAVHHYFRYREQQLRVDLAQLLRYGLVSLGIGLLFLVACLTLRRLLSGAAIPVDRTIADEGLLILGWVAMWRPIEILLYDWWPLARRRRLMRSLAVLPVEVRPRA